MPKEIGKFNCPFPFCTSSFVDKPNLAKHMKRCTKNPDFVPFVCPKCKKEFGRKERLNSHIEICIGSNKKHKCKDCNSEFDTSYQLDAHRRYKCEALGIVNYKCKLGCGFESIYEPNVNYHERTNCRLNTSLEMLYCECSSQFSNEKSLLKHKKYYCSISSKGAEYPCPACEVTFKDSSIRNCHYLYDCKQNEKRIEKYICLICGVLQLKSSFKEHMMRCQSTIVNGKLQPIEFTFEELQKSLDDQSTPKRNYVYSISSGSDLFKHSNKLKDYVGTGTAYRFLVHFVAAHWPSFNGELSPKLKFIKENLDIIRVSMIYLKYHRMSLFLEANLINKFYDKLTNAQKEIANLSIIVIKKDERDNLILKAVKQLDAQLKEDKYISISKEFIDVIINEALDSNLAFSSYVDLQSYVSKAICKDERVIDKIFMRFYGFSLLK